jgi:hypothetical protein
MIKVLVVVSGLVLLVPDPGADPRGVTGIVLATGSEGSTITEHVPALRQQLDPHSTRVWNLEVPGFDVVLEIENPIPDANCFRNWDHFAALTELQTDDDDFRVRNECVEGFCKQGSTDLVAGHVRFEGCWQTRAVSRCTEDWDKPPQFRDRAMLSFRKASDVSQQHPSFGMKRMATGLALEARVRSIDDIVLKVDGVSQELRPSKDATCEMWNVNPEAAECVVLEVENWPDVEPSCLCSGEAEITDDCRSDNHFTAFYDLLETTPPPNERWLPFVEEGYCSCSGAPSVRNPPAVRCPPPTGVAAPAAP